MYLQPTEFTNDNNPKRIYFAFKMVADNNTRIMSSIGYADGSARDRAMKRLGRRFGIEVRK